MGSSRSSGKSSKPSGQSSKSSSKSSKPSGQSSNSAAKSDKPASSSEIQKAVAYLVGDRKNELLIQVSLVLFKIRKDNGIGLPQQFLSPIFTRQEIVTFLGEKLQSGISEESISKYEGEYDRLCQMVQNGDETGLTALIETEDCAISAKVVNDYYDAK